MSRPITSPPPEMFCLILTFAPNYTDASSAYMKTPTASLLLPQGVTPGAAIGAGGRIVRAIGMRHNVRCVVNPPQREIQFLGHRANVANAIADFQEVFEQIIVTCAESEKRTPVNAAGDRFIHLRALVKTNDAWMFEKRDKASVKVDAHTAHYEYRLVSASDEVADLALASEPSGSPWLYDFNSDFRERMISDVVALCLEQPDRNVRLKAAFGLTCFALRDQSLVSESFSWTQLLALQLVNQIQPRWSSVWDVSSSAINELLVRLLEIAAEQQAPIETTMTVYVATTNATNVEDVVVKYRYENYKWVPSASLRPRRVLLSQYDIGARTDLGCRVRAYACDASDDEAPEIASIADHLEVVQPTAGRSHFHTTVTARATMPSNRFVRGRTMKDNLEVDYQGLRFVVSFMNKQHSRARIECRLLETSADGNGAVDQQDGALAEALATLTDKVLHLTTPNESNKSG